MLRLNQWLALGRAVGAPKKNKKKQDPMKFSESVSDRRRDKVSYRGAWLIKVPQCKGIAASHSTL